MPSLSVFISRYPEALEVKVESFLAEFRRKGGKEKSLLHLKRVDYETIQHNLTQFSVFNEYTHFVFEEYLGNFKELAKLFEKIEIHSKVLITKTTEMKVSLPGNLTQKLEDKEYFLFLPSFKLKEQYLSNLLERLKLKIPLEYLEHIRREAFSSPFLIKGVLTQLQLMLNAGEKLSTDRLKNLIRTNKIGHRMDYKHNFLSGYLSKKIVPGTLFLRELNKKPNNVIIDFLRYFAFTLNNYFGKTELDPKTLEFIRKLSYNYFLFLERELFKIKSDSEGVLLYFFGKNQPKTVLILNNY